jgi:hypothetical protein
VHDVRRREKCRVNRTDRVVNVRVKRMRVSNPK